MAETAAILRNQVYGSSNATVLNLREEAGRRGPKFRIILVHSIEQE